MASLENEKEELEQKISCLKEENQPYSMEPASTDKFLQIINDLVQHINDMPEGQSRDQVFRAIRSLIDKVVIIPKGERQPVQNKVSRLLAGLF